MLPEFTLAAILTHWQFSPVVTAIAVVMAGCYGWGVMRVARRHPARPWPAWRTMLFGAGLLVIVLATESGIGAYDDILFTDHMIQHVGLLMVAPPLLIAGQPLTLLLHASRNPLHTWVKRLIRSRAAAFLTWPVFGGFAYGAAVLASHLTKLATYTEEYPVWHDAEHAAFVVVGYLFFLPIIGTEPIRWRLSHPIRFCMLLLLMPIDTFTGVVLLWAGPQSPGVIPGPLPAWYPGAVSDLNSGGSVMWAGGDGVMVVLMLVVLLIWARDRRGTANGRSYIERAREENLAALVASVRPGGQHAVAEPSASRGRTIDDDAHLAAYNEYLAALNRQHDPA